MGFQHMGRGRSVYNVKDMAISTRARRTEDTQRGSNLGCKGLGALRRRLANGPCSHWNSMSIGLYEDVHGYFDGRLNELGQSEIQLSLGDEASPSALPAASGFAGAAVWPGL
jgi:hypothetical protein